MYDILFNGRAALMRCGPIDPISSIASGVFGTVNTGITNAVNYDISRQNNETQMAIASANNAMQERLNESNNQFASGEAEKARSHDFQMMAAQHQYDSPVEQVRRYQEAGLNPAVMMQGQSAIGSSTPNSGAQATPHGSGVSPSMPIFDTAKMALFPDVVGNVFQQMEALSRIKKNEAESGQTNTLTPYLESLYKEQVKSLELQNRITDAYGMLQADAQVQDIVKSVALKSQQIESLVQEGKVNEAKAELIELQKETERQTAKLTRQNRKLVEKQNETYFQRFESDLREQSARTHLASSQAVTEDRLRELRADVLSADASTQIAAKQKIWKETEKIISETYNLTPQERNEMAELQRLLMHEEVNAAHFDNSFVGRLVKIIGGVAPMPSSFGLLFRGLKK